MPKDKLNTMLDQIVDAGLVDRTIDRLDDRHYAVANQLSVVDPTWATNLFARLREAIQNVDPAAAEQVMLELSEFELALSVVRKVIRQILAVLDFYPEIYGGNGGE